MKRAFLMLTTSTLLLACLGMAANAQQPPGQQPPGQEQPMPRLHGQTPGPQMDPRAQMDPRGDRMPPGRYYDEDDPDEPNEWRGRRMSPWHGRMMQERSQERPWMQRREPQGPMMHGPMGMMGPGMGGPQMMMRMMMIMMDADGDGAISLQEFQAMHERFFKAMDADKDGRLTPEEFRNFWSGMRTPQQPQPQQPQQPQQPPR